MDPDRQLSGKDLKKGDVFIVEGLAGALWTKEEQCDRRLLVLDEQDRGDLMLYHHLFQRTCLKLVRRDTKSVCRGSQDHPAICREIFRKTGRDPGVVGHFIEEQQTRLLDPEFFFEDT